MTEREPSFAAIDRLLDDALEIPPHDRRRWIAEACGDDRVLRAKLERLLDLAEGADEFLPPGAALPGPVWEAFAREFDGSLPPGHRVGIYELRGVVGVGGMGRVYRAFDTVLNREVAMKALVDPRGDQAQAGRQRLEREARLLATLNHPNIAAIYGFERAPDAFYLILELVEGETLGERLRSGALPVAETLAIALQVTLALQEAHRRGIVHRDLKPANIKLTPDGQAKVLDFGVAKSVGATEADGTSGREPRQATAAAPLAGSTTESSSLVGTPAYMSPEHVRGEPVDARTDVWAFGCVLYEMLTAQPAFQGASAADTITSILGHDVRWSRLPVNTPPALVRLLRRCLERDPALRLDRIGEARRVLHELELKRGREERRRARSSSRKARLRRIPWIVVAAVLGFPFVAPTTRHAFVTHGSADERGSESTVTVPAGAEISRDLWPAFAISPDGARVALTATIAGISRLFVEELTTREVRAIDGSDGAAQPFFSADGREVAFFADLRLKKVSVSGGPVVEVAQVGPRPRGGSWGASGTMVFARAKAGLFRIDPDGSRLAPVTKPDGERGESWHRWPQILPGGEWVLFTVTALRNTFDDDLEVVSLVTGQRRKVLRNAYHGRYVAGRLFFTRRGQQLAVPFDPEKLSVDEEPPVVVLEGVRHDQEAAAAHFALSESGVLIHRPPSPPPRSYVAWIDADGAATRLDGPRQFRRPRLSPDGRRLAVCIGAVGACELGILDIESRTVTRLPLTIGTPHRPIWTPDGQGITVGVERQGLWSLVTLSATDPARVFLIYEGNYPIYPNAWSPDGGSLVVEESRIDTGWDVRVLEMGANGRAAGTARDLAASPVAEQNAALSADGRWVAYAAGEPARIYVVPLDASREAVRASPGFGGCPRWGPAGQLYYWRRPTAPPSGNLLQGLYRTDWHEQSLTEVALGTKGAPASTMPSPPAPVDLCARYDVDRSGAQSRILVLEPEAPEPAPWDRPPVLTPNWLDTIPVSDGRQR